MFVAAGDFLRRCARMLRSQRDATNDGTANPQLSRLSAKARGLYIAAMSDFRTLSADYSVAPQITLEDVAEAKAAGFAMIVNNRPDGEEPSAPQGDDIAHAAAA
eukprot:gene5823-7426_t